MTSAAATPFKPFWSLLAAAVVLWLLWWHAAILAPFVASLVLAYALHPAVDKMVTYRVPRALAVSICLLVVLLLGAVLFVLLVPIVSELAPRLRDQLPDLLVALWAKQSPFLAQWGLTMPPTVEALKAEALALFKSHAAQWSGAVWSSLLVGGSSVMAAAGLIVLVPMLAFYWLLDWYRLTGRFRHLLPARWQPVTQEVMAECDELMGQYLRGQVLVMLIMAAFYGIGLSLFGFNLALPIGVFTGLAICIPYLGFGVGLVLASLAGLLQFGAGGDGAGHPFIAIVVVYGLGQVLESFFLTPRMVGERIGLHPLGVILALMAFGKWMGFVGVLIALPTSAFLMVLGRRLLRVYESSSFYLSR
jgi:predicted PurR-regulated permease PerM